jgi:hypothetical protein
LKFDVELKDFSLSSLKEKMVKRLLLKEIEYASNKDNLNLAIF